MILLDPYQENGSEVQRWAMDGMMTWGGTEMKFDPKSTTPKIAYMSMGAYLESYMPTYSGGLEILAGDTLRTCADMGIPIVGFIQASNNGFYRQRIKDNLQVEESVFWDPQSTLQRLDESVFIRHKGRDLRVGAEVFPIIGQTGHVVPVYLMDSNFDDNFHNDWEDDRQLTSQLYSNEHRIAQENILGQGSVKLARALGYRDIETFHMNEGHACFATLELLAENGFSDDDVRNLCVFTTHTPVPAGHDVFSYDSVREVVGDNLLPWHIGKLAGEYAFNTTQLATSLSRYVNGVARMHGKVCARMDLFRNRKVDHITNGVHVKTWASQPMAEFYDEALPGWKHEPSLFEKAVSVPTNALLRAKSVAKRQLICYVNSECPTKFRQDVLTIVWARRFACYKRPELLFHDVDRLERITEKYGNIQIIFTGKPHPQDAMGKASLHRIIDLFHSRNGGGNGNCNGNGHDRVRCAFLPGYSATLSIWLLGGADIWLNTPRRPKEASGTSGMKASLNGAVNLSVYDGWWVEGMEMNPEAGWTIGPRPQELMDETDDCIRDLADAESLYDNLEDILKTYYGNQGAWGEKIRHSITLAAYFNTHRMVKEYAEKAWNLKFAGNTAKF
jgi:starch phosphorylase